MIDQEKFIKYLQNNGIEFITGVPDTLLNDFCLFIENQWPKDKHIIAANEGNAVAIAAGYHLATGSIPLVYMQNSGLGNTVNPLLSLTHKEVYSIPMILLIGWRGQPGIKDHAQHKKQGELTPVLLSSMDIPYKIIEDNLEYAINAVSWALNTAKNMKSPVALLATKGVFAKASKEDFKEKSIYPLSREQAIECILKSVPPDTIFVASTGRITRELYALRDLHGTGHKMDFLNVGAMGHASSIATGIAIANKNKLVVCLDGDAAAIMHLGALTTSGTLGLSNFLHVVLNNGVHESVGGQETAGFKVNLTQIAKYSGYTTTETWVSTKTEIENQIRNLLLVPAPSFLEIKIKKGIRKNLPPLSLNHQYFKDIFMEELRNK